MRAPADPTRALQLTKGRASIHAWASSDICIDFSERAHALMRQDLGGSGHARNPTVASNRVFMKMCMQCHAQAGGASVCPVCVGQFALSDAREHSKGGSAYMEYHNFKLHSYKQLHAPDRPLTEDETRAAEEKITRGWESIRNGPQYATWLA
eukprot:113748-Pyramimonas_sp.AAC.2